MIVAEVIFIASLILIAYAYVGYPALAYWLSRFLARPVRQAEITPKVSIVITAYNEERDIAAKLENTLALDYPKDKLEIIVASDCSADRTDEIVQSFAARGVKLHRRPERLGKTVAQNWGVRRSTGEIIVLSDATTHYQQDALRLIVRNFADPEVGCVAGQLVYVDRSTTAVGQSCRSYWNYEKFIKQSESQLGSLIGVSGCLYAIRRSCFTPLAPDMIDDFVIASEIHLQGGRTVYEPNAIALEDTNQRGRDEFRMRVRVIEQTMRALHRYREVLSLRRHGLFAWQMISHKIMRYAVAFLLITAFFSNLLLVTSSDFYAFTFAGQALFYLAALVGYLSDRQGRKLGLLGAPYYFVLVNAAVLVAYLKFLQGKAHVVWVPMRGASATGSSEATGS